MRASRLAELVHQWRRCGQLLLLATVAIIRRDTGNSLLLEAYPEALHGAKGNRERGNDLMGVRLLLPAFKKSSCEVEPEERGT
jgi:hypothetical protein